MARRTGRLVLLATLASCAIPADELPRGRVIDRVVCAGNERQTYALYLPPAYSPDRAWPILYCLDPVARGRVPVERFAEAAGLAGWIVAGSNNSRNGSQDDSREAIHWLLLDTHVRFVIDDARLYAAGFSGGARLALAWAGNGRIAGVVACGAGFTDNAIPKDIAFRVFATAGVEDFNFDEVYGMSRELSRRGAPQRFSEFPGAHDWLPAALTGPAIDFLSGRLAPEPPPPPSPEQRKVAGRYAALTEELQRSDESGRGAILEKLRRDAKLPEDGVDRRVARRVLRGTFVGAMEQGTWLFAGRRYSEAAQAWNLAVMAQPDSGEAYYRLATAQAGAREKRKALDALKRAVASGFRDRDRIEREPLFAALRGDPGFAAAISALGN